MLPTPRELAISAPVVEIQNQVLKQGVRIVGTGFSLHYRSDRVPGRRSASTVRIPLTGKSVPGRVKKILLELEVAGQRHTREFPAQPDQSYTFHWDGLDASGRAVAAPQTLKIRIGYVQRAFYPRPELTRWYERTSSTGPRDARAIGLGGWTLTPHHSFDPQRMLLHYGNGTRSHAFPARAPARADQRPAANGPLASDLTVPSSDGKQQFVFDPRGRHLRTVDTDWNVVLYRFEYDGSGQLASIADQNGNTTRIERDAGLRIVSPGGMKTELTLGEEGYLSIVTNPAGHAVRCHYAGGGLLAELVDPEGNAYRFSYDEEGKLIRREEPSGAFTSYASRRTDQSSSVAIITASGRESVYEREHMASGDELRRTACCGGRAVETQISKDGARTVSYPDGSTAHSRAEGGAQVFELKLPSGLVRRVVRKTTTDGERTINTIEVNGNVHTSTFDRVRRERSFRSAEGFGRIERFDEHGRLIEMKVDGRHATRHQCDDAGQLVKVFSGPEHHARTTTFSYDAHGRISEVTDPVGQMFRLEYDEAGFAARQILPEGRVVFAHDKNGNQNSITPPDRPPHSFDRNPVNRVSAYRSPSAGGGDARTTYGYDSENRLIETVRPDGTRIEQRYDAVGALASVATPLGVTRLEFDPKTLDLHAVITPDGTVVSYEYDGILIAGLSWSGAVKGSVERKHDNDFRIRAFSVNGAEIERRYNRDGQLLGVGELQIRRDPATRRIGETTLHNVKTMQTYDGFGDPETFRAWVGEREIFTYTLHYDALGRVIQKDEMIEGQRHRYSYEYDAAGRLQAVARDSQPIARYEYGANGNRVSSTNGTSVRKAEFDDADQILRNGELQYQHNPNGERSGTTLEGRVTRYGYDAFGNLLSVVLPHGEKIDYLLDGEARRLGKKVNGQIVQAFLYRDRITPIAEVGQEGNVRARFVFGPREQTPDYLVKDTIPYRLLTDYQGGVRLVVNSRDGTVAQRLDYDAFGNVLLDTNPGFQPFGFAGGIHDTDTGLVHFGAREYDPDSGRWITRDPALFGGANANLYGYVFNDPVNFADPWGLLFFPGQGPLPEWHENRNAYNKCPPSPPDLQTGPEDCPEPTGWSREGKVWTHGEYTSYRHEYGYQCVYDGAGDLVTDPDFAGTFDYSPPYNPDGTISPGGVAGHIAYDFLPWLIWN